MQRQRVHEACIKILDLPANVWQIQIACKKLIRNHSAKDVEMESTLQWRYNGIGDTRIVGHHPMKSAGTE